MIVIKAVDIRDTQHNRSCSRPSNPVIQRHSKPEDIPVVNVRSVIVFNRKINNVYSARLCFTTVPRFVLRKRLYRNFFETPLPCSDHPLINKMSVRSHNVQRVAKWINKSHETRSACSRASRNYHRILSAHGCAPADVNDYLFSFFGIVCRPPNGTTTKMATT